ncbi:MAG: hypothetical protein MJZ90_10445 [Bacteroidales bacterium]|nr:hypothetical protein [Bacteroidales bacterium]
MKKILKILVWILTVGAIVTGWVFTHKGHVEHPLNGIVVNLHRDVEDGFINYDAVIKTVAKICDTTKNREVTMIPVDSVRSYLNSIPWAVASEANISLDETLIVELVECQPVMRIYNNHGKSVYLDAEGRVFPICGRYTPHVLIGSGYLDFPVTETASSIYDEKYKDTCLPQMFGVMMEVLKNSYTRCCVKQVYLAKNRWYELSMNNVDPEVVLGDGENVGEKLTNLGCFFEQMQGNPDLKEYKKINFNFDNQVVCTKNNKK